ncbi:DMT family transporter [Mycolicibacterium sarraceniae]|uniref:Multidrug transporter n=1 Tax=Mycolicibacterium sarraceniae TaxID=1534348 RepID=A0A7I7SQT9_9MYCO|nr:DMT family transporter [Mycolicibacterium sarraceniae]BBY59364.1 multidrug transporter [Mycolicibacterium sarraceniae]
MSILNRATPDPAINGTQPPAGSPSHRTVDVALLAVAIVWGSSYLAAKEVVTTDSVFSFLVIRFALAAVGLAIVLASRLRHINRTEIALGMIFGTILSIIFSLETFGVTMTSASNAGLIISLTIVMTPLLQRWIQRTYLPPAFYGAAVIAVVGVGLLTQNGGFATPSLGDLLILLAAAARAVHVTAIARLSEKRTLDSARVTLVQLCTGLFVFTVLSQISGRGVGEVARQMSTQSWILTIYLALVCTVFAFFIQIWAVRRTSPARVSLLLGTEPLWAATIGVLLAHDPVSVIGVTGALLILLGTNWGRIIDTRRRAEMPATIVQVRP